MVVKVWREQMMKWFNITVPANLPFEEYGKLTLKLHRWWSKALSKQEWSRDEYYERLIHLDETVKLFVRTSFVFCSDVDKRCLLESLLPTTTSHQRNIRFQWGMWFQALKGLAEYYDAGLSDSQNVVTKFRVVEEILRNGGFLQHFLSELDFPDYEGFARTLSLLGLNRSAD
jgi:hypothetical protein